MDYNSKMELCGNQIGQLIRSIFNIEVNEDSVEVNDDSVFVEILFTSKTTNDVVFVLPLIVECNGDDTIVNTFMKEVCRGISEGLIDPQETENILHLLMY